MNGVGFYTGLGEDVLVVFGPGLGFTTGGGTFFWPGTADPIIGYLGDRTNFGFTMKYNPGGTNVRGSLLVISHLPDGSIVRFKSNALDGLAVGEAPDADDSIFGWATFSGKGTFKAADWIEPIGNYTFITYVEDHGEPGAGVDRFWLEVRDKDGVIEPDLSLAAPATTNAITIFGGNIVSPHTNNAP